MPQVRGIHCGKSPILSKILWDPSRGEKQIHELVDDDEESASDHGMSQVRGIGRGEPLILSKIL